MDRVRQGTAISIVGRRRKSAVVHAQSLVEFALIVPLMLLLAMGALDLGRVFYVKIVLESAAREGAMYLTINPTDVSACSASPCSMATTTGTFQAAQNEAANSGVSLAAVGDVVVTYASKPPVSGSTVAVTVNETVPLFIFQFFGGPVQLSSTVRMMEQ